MGYEKDALEFTEIFENFLKRYSEFSEISEIARKNTRSMGRNIEGRIWIIGGFVYRPIIEALYGEIPKLSETDIDFLIQRGPASQDVYTPKEKGWEIKRTESGYYYVINEEKKTRIDLNYLYNFPSILARNPHPRMGNFFGATPLNVQSIAYKLTGKRGIIGDIGIRAIRSKIVRVNNLEAVKFEANKRKETVEDLVIEKAKEINFDYDLTLPQGSITQMPNNKKEQKNSHEEVK